MAISVLRRYTPPTCTLDVSATRSPLSRWTDRPVLNQLRFQLSLDDPRVLDDRHVTLTGDRTQLEALCEVVADYVQRLLDLDLAQFDPSVPTGTASDLLPLAPPSAAAPALPGLVAPAIASASERTSPLEPEREMAFST
ncbi:MAG TPA: DUF4335 domain-containing protein, partial [Chroococcidiopsis sp.]